MPRFKHYNYDQDAMVVINYQEQLQLGTFEHAVHYLIEHKLDLSVFHPKYRNEDTGRLAYDPAILLKIILFAYSKGITSSREMQWCCETNIIFKALSCDTVPHFTTLAKFVSSHSNEIEELFEQVLLVCHDQGLLGCSLRRPEPVPWGRLRYQRCRPPARCGRTGWVHFPRLPG